ncbi:MAG: hypothetical protein M1824_006578 [Vezdaea acicularis]|nr:MAG: hypothetical protein M1824_006578 [Vezdaea acicularis]
MAPGAMASLHTNVPPVKWTKYDFKPVQRAWPPAWKDRHIEGAIYATFGLFSSPSDREMARKLFAIENDPNDWPCRAIRRGWNIKKQPEFDDNIVELFKETFPTCDKTDGQIGRALKQDILIKNKILVQALKEDGIETKLQYRLSWEHEATLVRYPIFNEAEEGTGAYDDPLATVPEFGNWADALNVTKVKHQREMMSAMALGSPSPSETPNSIGRSEEEYNNTVSDKIACADANVAIQSVEPILSPVQSTMAPPGQIRRSTTHQPVSSAIRSMSITSSKSSSSSSSGSEMINAVVTEAREETREPDTYVKPDRLSVPRTRPLAATSPSPAPTATPSKPIEHVSTALTQVSTTGRTARAGTNPLWTPGAQFPAGTWQPTDGHGDKNGTNWLLYDPRGPLPILDSRGYSADNRRLMTFPVYVNLSDRATGHVIMSMVSYRMKLKYWPNNFRKDARLARNYVSRGAGFFFVDGRVGAVDTIKLLGADFHGKIPKHYNLPIGSAQSNDQLQDLPSDDLAVADCFLPGSASNIDGTQPSVGPGRYASEVQSVESQPIERPNTATRVPAKKRVTSTTTAATSGRQASSPPKGSSLRLSKVSKKALFEESKAIREEVRTHMARLEELNRQLESDTAPLSAQEQQRQREPAPAPSSSPPQRVLPQTISFQPINEPGPSVRPDHRRSSTQTFDSINARSPSMATGRDNRQEDNREEEAASPTDDLYANSPRPSPPRG